MSEARSTVELKGILPSAPNTVRGRAFFMNYDPKNLENFVYPAGKEIYIRNIDTPENCRQYTEHRTKTTVAAYSYTGNYIASADDKGNLRIWGLNSDMSLKGEYRILSENVNDLRWSTDSQRIVVGGMGSMYGHALMSDTGASIGGLVGHSKQILSVDFKPTRPFKIVTASEDNNVGFFTGPPFKFTQMLKGGHENFVNCVRFSPAGEHFVTCSSDKRLVLYDAKTGDKTASFGGEYAHDATVYCVAWNPESTQLLSSSADKTVRLWDVETQKCLTTFTFGPHPTVNDMQMGCMWHPRHMLSVSLSGAINYLDPAQPSVPRNVLHGHHTTINAITFSESDGAFYTACSDRDVLSWNVKDHYKTQRFSNAGASRGHKGKISCALSSSSPQRLYTGSWDDTLMIHNTTDYDYAKSISHKLSGQPKGLAEAHDALLVITGTRMLQAFDNTQMLNEWSLKFMPTALAFNKNTHLVAISDATGKIHVFRLPSISTTELSLSYVLSTEEGEITTLEFSHDSRYLAVGHSAGIIVLYEGQEVVTKNWRFHTARISSLSWNTNNLNLCSGAMDGSVFVWNVEKPRTRASLMNVHNTGVTGVQWVSNDEIIAVGENGAVKSIRFNL